MQRYHAILACHNAEMKPFNVRIDLQVVIMEFTQEGVNTRIFKFVVVDHTLKRLIQHLQLYNRSYCFFSAGGQTT